MVNKTKAALLNVTPEFCIVLHSAFDNDQQLMFREERNNIKGLSPNYLLSASSS